VTGPVTAFDDDIVDISLDVSANLWLKHYANHSSESWASIFQTFWHSHKTKSFERGDETGFLLILLRHPTLMVARETIQQRHNRRVGHRVHNLIHPWEWVVVFWCSLVEVSEVDTHPPFPILFLDRHRVDQPLGVHDLGG
jgi:hypothetical protein